MPVLNPGDNPMSATFMIPMNAPQKKTVYILDDDPLIVHLLKHILEERDYRTKAYLKPADFLKLKEPFPSSCLVVDLQMPDMDGIQVQNTVRDRDWNLPVIFISAYGTVPTVAEAMKRGGVDFIEKPLNEANVLAAVGRALELSRQRHLQRCERESAQKKIRALTEREFEVLQMLVRGHLNKQIASDLGICERTVKVHRSRVLAKLGVDSVTLAMPIVLAAGMLADTSR